jgi:hypothetical protein
MLVVGGWKHKSFALVAVFVVSLWSVVTAATWVPMTKRGNVRYGPSTSAPIIKTLSVGTQVELLGPAEGRPGWYEIAFPKEGGAWMHKKVLAPTASPEEWTVTVEGASVRSDSRIRAELVGQLRRGTVVKHQGFKDASGAFKGISVGAWLKVYPTGATAYVYQSVIGLDQAAQQQMATAPGAIAEAKDPWQRALNRYSEFRRAYEENQSEALLLDWEYLASEFDSVAKGHPNQAIRVGALRYLKAVRQIVPHAKQAQARAGVQPKMRLPRSTYQQPAPVARPAPAPPTITPAAPTTQPVVAVSPAPPAQAQQPAQPAPTTPTAATRVAVSPAAPAVAEQKPAQLEPAQPVQAAAPVVLPAEVAPTQPAAAAAAMGWLEQRDVAGQNANHVLIDGTGAVCAVIEPAPGADVSLAQYFWRRVSAEGTSRMITVEGKEVPLITATAVRLATR